MQVVSRRGEVVVFPSGGHKRPMAAILPLSSHNGQGIWRWKFVPIQLYNFITRNKNAAIRTLYCLVIAVGWQQSPLEKYCLISFIAELKLWASAKT